MSSPVNSTLDPRTVDAIETLARQLGIAAFEHESLSPVQYLMAMTQAVAAVSRAVGLPDKGLRELIDLALEACDPTGEERN